MLGVCRVSRVCVLFLTYTAPTACSTRPVEGAWGGGGGGGVGGGWGGGGGGLTVVNQLMFQLAECSLSTFDPWTWPPGLRCQTGTPDP